MHVVRKNSVGMDAYECPSEEVHSKLRCSQDSNLEVTDLFPPKGSLLINIIAEAHQEFENEG